MDAERADTLPDQHLDEREKGSGGNDPRFEVLSWVGGAGLGLVAWLCVGATAAARRRSAGMSSRPTSDVVRMVSLEVEITWVARWRGECSSVPPTSRGSESGPAVCPTERNDTCQWASWSRGNWSHAWGR
jgi:hypothetical protein